MVKNNVEKFFIKLAEHLDISINYKWKTELFYKIGQIVEISSANRISGWILRGYIPELSMNNILKMELPGELKELCRACAKIKKPSKADIEKQIEVIRGQKQLKHEEIITLFRDPDLALELNMDLVELESLDKQKYDFVRGMVRGFVLDRRPKKKINDT